LIIVFALLLQAELEAKKSVVLAENERVRRKAETRARAGTKV
jgi:hypothetical protein